MRFLILALAAVFGFAAPASAQTRSREAAAFAALREACEADNGALWGVRLCGPLRIVDPQTRAVWASQQDDGGLLQRRADGGWTGVLPEGVPVANSTVEWAGVRWIMIMQPLSEDPVELRVLVLHESWHHIQDTLGLPARESQNAHLETEMGRYYLRLEMRALSTALLSSGRARREAAADALLFRAARHAAFPAAAAAETALDRNEGLASYTGVRLALGDGADAYAARSLDGQDGSTVFSRTYAYRTAPAYGILLDQRSRGWRRALGDSAPADLLARAIRVREPTRRRVADRAERYGGPEIAAEERRWAEARRVRVEGLRRTFSENPRLELPISRIQLEFDPGQVEQIEGLGTLYGVITARDAWGEVRVVGGAVIAEDFSHLILPAPNPDRLSGAGWALALDPAFTVAAEPDQSGAIRVASVSSAETTEPAPN